MPQRLYTLTLEVFDAEVFYHWNYDPPVRNIGGGTGTLLPGEFMGDVPYEKLHAMGSGTHSLAFDETWRDKFKNPLRSTESEDDRLMRRLRFTLFAKRVHCSTAAEVFCEIILGMTPGNADRIMPLLTSEHISELETYASNIASTAAERALEGHEIFSNAGSMPIPDENLETIREYFLNRRG